MLVFINVYEVSRQYGGPEEGGWWYDHFACVGSIPHRTDNGRRLIYEDEDGNDIWEVEVAAKKQILFDVWGFGPIWMAGHQGPRFVYYLEKEFAESNTTETPRYE